MATFYNGKAAQAFPSFGVERKGAPVVAFTKIADQFIRSREQIYQPDYIIIQDPSLIQTAAVLTGAKKTTVVIVNSSKLPEKVCPNYTGKVYCVPALDLALKILGKPIINTIMLGAFAKISQLIEIEAAQKAIKENLGEKYGADVIKKNIQALTEAYNS